MKQVLFLFLVLTGFAAKAQWIALPLVPYTYCGQMFPSSGPVDVIPYSDGGILYTASCEGTPMSGNTVVFYYSHNDLRWVTAYYSPGPNYNHGYVINSLNASGDSLFSYCSWSLGNGNYAGLLKGLPASNFNLSGPNGLGTIGSVGRATSITNEFVYCIYTMMGSDSFKTYQSDKKGNALLKNTLAKFTPVPDKLQFINDSTGFTLASTKPNTSTITVLLKTINFGTTWTSVLSDSIDPIVDYKAFASGQIYLCEKSGKVYRSTDKGTTWSSPNAAPPGSYSAIAFMNDSCGYIAGTAGSLYKTSDFGHSWTAEISNTTLPITNLYAFGNTVYFKDSTLSLYKNKPLVDAVAVLALEKPSLSLFPNPFSETITLDCPFMNTTMHAEAFIYNSQGALVYALLLREKETILDLHYLAKGLYYVRIFAGEQAYCTKLIRE